MFIHEEKLWNAIKYNLAYSDASKSGTSFQVRLLEKNKIKKKYSWQYIMFHPSLIYHQYYVIDDPVLGWITIIYRLLSQISKCAVQYQIMWLTITIIPIRYRLSSRLKKSIEEFPRQERKDVVSQKIRFYYTVTITVINIDYHHHHHWPSPLIFIIITTDHVNEGEQDGGRLRPPLPCLQKGLRWGFNFLIAPAPFHNCTSTILTIIASKKGSAEVSPQTFSFALAAPYLHLYSY